MFCAVHGSPGSEEACRDWIAESRAGWAGQRVARPGEETGSGSALCFEFRDPAFKSRDTPLATGTFKHSTPFHRRWSRGINMKCCLPAVCEPVRIASQPLAGVPATACRAPRACTGSRRLTIDVACRVFIRRRCVPRAPAPAQAVLEAPLMAQTGRVASGRGAVPLLVASMFDGGAPRPSFQNIITS